MKLDNEWHKVESSNIEAMRYDPETKDLDVRFRSGQEYRYDGVPKDEVTKVVESKSVGKAFYQYIRSQYEAEKLEKENR